jgi:hypothetical protein
VVRLPLRPSASEELCSMELVTGHSDYINIGPLTSIVGHSGYINIGLLTSTGVTMSRNK